MRSTAAVALIAALLVAPSAARAAPTDVAFDQVQRIYVLGAEPPPLGTFDDLKSTFSSLGPSVFYPALPGTIGGLARQREGVLYHYSFLGTLERVDDPAASKSTIGRPDKGEVDYVDFKAKTYMVLTGDAAKALLQPNIMQQMSNAMNVPTAAQPKRGTISMSVQATTSAIAAHAFDGTSASGYQTNSTVTATPTGQCPSISAKVAVTVYVDPARTEPFVKANSAFNIDDVSKAMGALGCTATIAGPVPVPDPALAHFFYYERADATLALPMMPAPIQTSSVLERAHLTALTAADAGLFEIPAGFTRSDAPQPAAAAPGSQAAPAK